MKERKWVTKCVHVRKKDSQGIKCMCDKKEECERVYVCVCVCVSVWMNESVYVKGRKSVTEPMYERNQMCLKLICINKRKNCQSVCIKKESEWQCV
jgi:hypothetical protein